MSFKFYQVAVLIISGVMLTQGVWRLVANYSSQSLLKVLMRFAVWGGMIVVAIFPNITNALAEFIGMEGNINSVMLVGFLLIFLVIFRILSIIERIEKDISVLTRKDALSDFTERKK